MSRSARSAALLFAKVGAVAFALSACGYLVVTAQRRANPVVEEVPAAPLADAVPAVKVPPEDPTFLPSTKILIIDGPGSLESASSITLPVEPKSGEPTFLPGTKSQAVETSILEPSAGQDPSFMFSSKSGPVTLTLPPSASPPAPPAVVAPATSTLPDGTGGAAANGTAPNPEPVFLPSSKVKVLSPLRPQTTTSGTQSTSKPVFLPSSKSLSIDGVKPPAPKPAPAPIEPPKNR